MILLFFGVVSTVRSQEVSVEKSTFGLQTGILGVWVHHEAKLSNTIVLRTELGLDSEIFDSSSRDQTGFLLTPVITLEPKYYYNLKKRFEKSRKIDGNSGNFISLHSSYHPAWFTLSNTENVEVIRDITLIPTWGIRRNIGNHFTYEAGFGIGYRYIFLKREGFQENQQEIAANLHLRLGYRF